MGAHLSVIKWSDTVYYLIIALSEITGWNLHFLSSCASRDTVAPLTQTSRILWGGELARDSRIQTAVWIGLVLKEWRKLWRVKLTELYFHCINTTAGRVSVLWAAQIHCTVTWYTPWTSNVLCSNLHTETQLNTYPRYRLSGSWISLFNGYQMVIKRVVNISVGVCLCVSVFVEICVLLAASRFFLLSVNVGDKIWYVKMYFSGYVILL